MLSSIESLIVSSRVRLARNLENLPFKTKSKGVFDGVAATIKVRNQSFVSTRVSDLSPDMARALFEQHLISRELLNNKINSIIVASNDNKIVVMLGEEDHIRIQCIQTGMDLQTAYKLTKKIADDIESAHEVAHRREFGYLTSCPTNLGTGMRASVMMFLPALTLTDRIGEIIEQLSNQHITVRGVYGEGSSAGGFMYQISNQACFGMTEVQILEMVESITMEIANLELKTQKQMYKDAPEEIIDRVMRAWGLLTNAYMLSSSEAVQNLAVLKLGACVGIIKFKNVRILDDLFFIIQPNTLVTVDNRASSVIARDKIRAARIAEALRSSRV